MRDVGEEPNWIDEARGFDANAALDSIRAVWLRQARYFAACSGGDWVDDLKAADEAMGWAARAEACFWRATGEFPGIDVDLFVPQLRPTDAPEPSIETPKGET